MDRSYPERPFVGVGVVVFRGADVLLIQRGKPPRLGQWSLPGGMQEVGETVQEAGIREVMEETAVAVRLGGLVDVLDTIRRDDDGRVQIHYTLVDFWGEWHGGEPTPGSDAIGAAWVPLDNVDGLGMWSETVRIIRQADGLRRLRTS